MKTQLFQICLFNYLPINDSSQLPCRQQVES